MTNKPYSFNMFDVTPGDVVAMINKRGGDMRAMVVRMNDKSVWTWDTIDGKTTGPAHRESWRTFNGYSQTMKHFIIVRGDTIIASFCDGVRTDAGGR
jgi:hypothetical protein